MDNYSNVRELSPLPPCKRHPVLPLFPCGFEPISMIAASFSMFLGFCLKSVHSVNHPFLPSRGSLRVSTAQGNMRRAPPAFERGWVSVILQLWLGTGGGAAGPQDRTVGFDFVSQGPGGGSTRSKVPEYQGRRSG